jgi:hypothetical protein
VRLKLVLRGETPIAVNGPSFSIAAMIFGGISDSDDDPSSTTVLPSSSLSYKYRCCPRLGVVGVRVVRVVVADDDDDDALVDVLVVADNVVQLVLTERPLAYCIAAAVVAGEMSVLGGLPINDDMGEKLVFEYVVDGSEVVIPNVDAVAVGVVDGGGFDSVLSDFDAFSYANSHIMSSACSMYSFS